MERILEHVPHRELALQWDCATELQEAYRGRIEAHLPQLAVSKRIPRQVLLGFHLCFGTLGGWPRFAPEDLGAAVALANRFIGASGRPVDWMHIPALDRNDDAFYAPLEALEPGGTRIYLGMVHNMASFAERLALARRYLRNFGVAAYCGFGRLPASKLPRVLDEHREALRAMAPRRRKSR